jgi:hypothetical protein
VIEIFVEFIDKNAPMIRDLEAVEQLVTPQVLRLEPIIGDARINVQSGHVIWLQADNTDL